ncbi:sugar ABC transporter ATP-binding protein [bacterium]|nr:sugar ABC transporter ATP-binding protein [bacterium]
MKPVLRMEGITKGFSGVRVLHGVDFEVLPGEVMALMGENGAGKSTLMKILAGVHTDWEGHIHVDGREVRPASTREAEDAGIAIIYQELNLIPGLTVAENIFLGREPVRFGGVIDYGAMNDSARGILNDLHFTAPVTAPVSSLNIGNRQLVEIAKALSLNARILVMDEPTSALSEAETVILFSVVRKLRNRGVSVVYISHRMGEVFDIADRVTVLRDGSLIDVRPAGDVSRQELIRLMVGRDVDQFFVHKEAPQKNVVLNVSGLSRITGDATGKSSVRNVSFEVRRGENLGIAGLLGAGRTELLEALFGAAAPFTEGTVELDGIPRRFRNPADAIESGVVLIPEDRKGNGLVLGMTVMYNMTLAALKQAVRHGVLSRAKERQLAEGYVRDLSITASVMESPVESLSGGNQQKVMIAKWLATHPKVLLLDEPTRGIDVGAKHEIYELLSELTRQGIAIVLVSSEIQELLSLCDRIMVMREGEISAFFDREEATQEKILDAASPLA